MCMKYDWTYRLPNLWVKVYANWINEMFHINSRMSKNITKWRSDYKIAQTKRPCTAMWNKLFVYTVYNMHLILKSSKHSFKNIK